MEEVDPGAELLWFGKYKGEKQFSELPEDYVQIIMNKYKEDEPEKNPAYVSAHSFTWNHRCSSRVSTIHKILWHLSRV